MKKGERMSKVTMQYMIENDNERYLRPHNAHKKMKALQNIVKSVYIYGVAGSGKTSFIRNYLNRQKYIYLSGKNLTIDDLKITVERENKITLVIDEFHLIPMDEIGVEIRNEIKKIMTRGDIWLILCSRCPIPGWLMEMYYRQTFLVIEEKDLYLTEVELKEYFHSWQLNLSDEELKKIIDFTKGFGLMAKIVVMELSASDVTRRRVPLSDLQIEHMRNRFWDYIEYHVYNQWEPELREFLMQLSIVDRFDARLAGIITARNDAEKMIERAKQSGNFIIELFTPMSKGDDSYHVTYEFRRPMKRSMRRILTRDYTTEYCNRLYYNAGLYYQLEGNTPEALKMYELCDNTERIIDLLIDNARKNPGNGHYYELRKYYLRLPEDKIKDNLELMVGMSLLQSMLLNIEESERWYSELKKYSSKHSGSDRKVARSKLIFLDISLPHRGTVDMINILKNVGGLIERRDVIIPELSVTSNLPSMMNGGKDFCNWSKNDKKLASSIGKIVEFILGKYGKGLVNLALAESFLEKGGDSYEILTLANRGQMQAEAGGKVEQCFNAVGQLSWLHILNGNREEAKELLDSFYEKAVRTETTKLLPNIRAMQIRTCLYEGYTVEAIKWLKEEAPDEDKEFCTLQRFCYLTKVRIYIMIGRYEKALNLLQKLLYYAEEMSRTYIRMEANLLLAITQQRMGGDFWNVTLEKTLTEIESYHFVRLITREGVAINKLLNETNWEPKNTRFWKQVQSEAKKMAINYPSYLKMGTEEIILSDNAIKVLKLLSQGMTREEVAEKLGFTMANVKYHMNQAYKKLGVRNKTAAVTEARKHNFI